MSLFGALFTGVSGLGAQSQATAMVANNIANVNTVGFKRSEASFYSLVTSQTRSAAYSPGTVAVNRTQRVNEQGPVQQTNSATDAAISGNGFFVVKRDTTAGQEFLYTRSGSFSEDNTGQLRNTAGFALYGWPLDGNGNLPSNQGDLQSLVPCDVAFLGGLTRPTSSANLALNLNAKEVDSSLGDAVTGASDFTRGITVYDSLGSPQVLTMKFTKVYGPGAAASGTVGSLSTTTNLNTDLAMTNGSQFSVSIDGAAARVYDVGTAAVAPATPGDKVVTTVGDIISDINANMPGAHAYLGNNGELVISRTEFSGGAANSVTLTNVTGTPLASLGLATGTKTSNDLSGTTYNNGLATDSPPYSSGTFPTMLNAPGDPNYNDRGWWQMSVVHPDGSTISNGLVNFNGDGTLNALPDETGATALQLNNIDWGNGSSDQNIKVDIGRFSQFAGNYNVISSEQNGAELGLRTGVEITRDGYVVAQFSNGASTKLFKLPLVTFSNPNGLTEVSGTAYSKNSTSGEENLREAGLGGAGYLEASTVESSNVDLADEFAKLIVSQRAYSANTKVITTVDQMTEDLLRLR